MIFNRPCGHSDDTSRRWFKANVCPSCSYLLKHPRQPATESLARPLDVDSRPIKSKDEGDAYNG